MQRRSIVSFSLIFAIVVGLTGCTEIGMFSKTKSATVTDSITLATPSADILDVLTDTGKAMGWNPTARDNKQHIITFEDGSGSVLTGSVTVTRMAAKVSEDGKIIDLEIMVSGNFGYGTMENGQKVINKFKKKLDAKLKQS